MPGPKEKKTPCQELRDRYDRESPSWRIYRDAMTLEAEFLDGDRYENDPGPYEKDRRLNKIRGQETQDTIRHVAAKATEKPRSVEPRPIDKTEDADLGEAAASVVDQELSNPWKMFDDQYEEAIVDCREMRLGVVMMDWDPECGPYGEILYRRVDPRRVMWDSSWHPHHPLCSFFLEEKRVEVDEIHRTYPGTDWIQPDREAFTANGELKRNIPLIRGADGQYMTHHRVQDDTKATLWLCWYKNDKTELPPKTKPGSDAVLEPGQRYMSCVNGCGYRSETEAELGQRADGPPTGDPHVDGLVQEFMMLGELPEQHPGCPTCEQLGQVGTLERIDSKAEEEVRLAYSHGKRLVIMAPFSPAPDDKPIYDGKWPIPNARSFPVLILTAYTKGGRPMGPSDTTLMWDQQLASDQLRTLAVQRVFEHRNYWVLPSAGVTDFKGQRWIGRDDQFNFIYKDMTKAKFGPQDIQLLNGTGLDPSWQIAFNATQQALTQYRGMHDLGPVEERNKSKSGVALQTENAIGEVPVAHFNRRKNRELSRFYGVVWDYIRATYTPARLARLNLDGVDVMAALRGDDLPNYDFVIADTPDFTGLEKMRSEAFQALMQMVLDPATAPYAAAFAEFSNFPRSVIRRIEKIQADMAEKAMDEQADAAAAADAADMAGVGEPNDIDQLAMMSGLDGSGMGLGPAGIQG